jgi:quercetin dioxygenase-like cupin family protein
MASKQFIPTNEGWEDLGCGVSRQIMGWDKQLMMVKVRLEKQAVGAPHAHPHTQSTYCIDGVFEFTIDGVKTVIKKGEGLYIAPNQQHGTTCLEAGTLLDVFSPYREDFLK